MELKTIIFNSELEFRNYVILNSKDIFHILIFEDVLDCTIFFYCFTKTYWLVATKEPSSKGFSTYEDIYTDLSKENGFKIVAIYNQKNALRFVK